MDDQFYKHKNEINAQIKRFAIEIIILATEVLN